MDLQSIEKNERVVSYAIYLIQCILFYGKEVTINSAEQNCNETMVNYTHEKNADINERTQIKEVSHVVQENK